MIIKIQIPVLGVVVHTNSQKKGKQILIPIKKVFSFKSVKFRFIFSFKQKQWVFILKAEEAK